ncbi:glycoside hydrolase family 30 beta sandwich domain-containing protein [Granulicella cerasi]|uniref:Glycoside hydrolase family 30 beta sandwich domain-containing protein n=1 Tax=Granulicella cerasi TaxID=741063 RepID=A0ABW1Z9B8_9BACT|nr:glycoside hydrolase family 30 beta sandwich domain-containing protein [Granulicella cerasi]
MKNQAFARSLGFAAFTTSLLAACGCAGSSSSTAGNTTSTTTAVQVYQTTADGTQLLTAQTSINFGSTSGSGTTTIQVTPTTVLQPWDGVGGAMTDSAATVIAALPTAQQQSLMQQLFSTTSGAGLNMVRLPMGASDFSASGNYSYDDVAKGLSDPTLASFSIAHDLTNIVPLLQSAQSINPNLHILATPWSPPAWMKTNASMVGISGASQSSSQILTADFPYLANYFVKFVQAYSAQGLNVYAVTPQNEPLNSNSGYPSAILTANDEVNFIANYLGPAFTNAKLSTKIIAMDDNYADTAYAQTVLASGANAYIAGTAFHWYSGTPDAMSSTQALDSAKGVWFTEGTSTITCATKGSCPVLTASNFTGSGFKYQMQNLVMATVQNHARSVINWNLALNQSEGPQNGGCYTCVGLATVNTGTSTAQIYYNDALYAMGHVGRVATPGGSVIATTAGTAGSVQSIGFLNPDNTVGLVAFNGASSSTTITVAWNGKTFDYTMPAGSAVSFKWSVK